MLNYACVPNLQTAPKRHLLLKLELFLRKSILVLKGLTSTKLLEILHSNKTTNVRATNFKLLLSNHFLCASHFKFVRKYAPPWIRNIQISEFFRLFHIISTQIIYFNEKVYTLSRFATLRAISNLFSFFYIPCILVTRSKVFKSAPEAYFPLGDFIRATRSENKNPATSLVKIGWRKNSPRTSRKRSYFFVCSREQSRQVENML